jgi:hypothetical protein
MSSEPLAALTKRRALAAEEEVQERHQEPDAEPLEEHDEKALASTAASSNGGLTRYGRRNARIFRSSASCWSQAFTGGQ